MKYTIELTNKQKAQMDCIIEIVHRYVGFNPKLEMDIPLPMKESPAYKKGFEDGKNEQLDCAGLVNQIALEEEYKQAIADYRKFEKFFNSEGIEVFEDIRNTDGTISIDMILQYLPMREIMARIKAYKEKKKAEEEIKVGDEVISSSSCAKAIVTMFDDDDDVVMVMFEDGSCGTYNRKNFTKTSRHFDEVEQLLDKLKGEK